MKKKTTTAKKKTAKKKTTTKKTTAKRRAAAPEIIPVRPENEQTFAKLRKICLALPDAIESLNHMRPCFAVRDKTFAMFLDNHHGDGRVALWCKTAPGAQAMIVDSDPERYFVPPYVGKSGWIGARLDRAPDWKAIAAFVAESYAMTAPRRG